MDIVPKEVNGQDGLERSGEIKYEKVTPKAQLDAIRVALERYGIGLALVAFAGVGLPTVELFMTGDPSYYYSAVSVVADSITVGGLIQLAVTLKRYKDFEKSITDEGMDL